MTEERKSVIRKIAKGITEYREKQKIAELEAAAEAKKIASAKRKKVADAARSKKRAEAKKKAVAEAKKAAVAEAKKKKTEPTMVLVEPITAPAETSVMLAMVTEEPKTQTVNTPPVLFYGNKDTAIVDRNKALNILDGIGMSKWAREEVASFKEVYLPDPPFTRIIAGKEVEFLTAIPVENVNKKADVPSAWLQRLDSHPM